MDDPKEKFELVKGKKYEITFNPNDKYQFATPNIRNRHNKICNLLCEIFLGVDAIYCMYAEISQPQFGDKYKNTVARIHWHGIIEFERNRDICDFYLNHWHKLTAIGRIQLNKFRPNYWPQYICKHRRYFQYLKIDIKNNNLNNIINNQEETLKTLIK